MKKSIAKAVTIICACVLASVLGACSMSSVASGTKTTEQAQREYISQVNESMIKLNDSLVPFVEATSRGDVVSMKAAADNAYKALDGLSAIQAPDGMSDVRDQYQKGASTLREALDSYIGLYSDVVAGGSVSSVSSYSSRLSDIQSKYNEGVEALKNADASVASMMAGKSSSSSSK